MQSSTDAPVLVQHPGGVAPHRVEGLAGRRPPRRRPRRRRGSERPEVLGHDWRPSRVVAQQHLEAEVGQALGQQALRRADEEDRLLDVAAPADQADLLAGVLGVVAGVGLVGDEVAERGAEHGQVGVDGDPAAEVAEVVVEAGPRLVGDELEVDVLAVGQAEQRVGARAEVVGQRVDRGVELVDGHRLRLAPGHVAARRARRCRAGRRRGLGGPRRTRRRAAASGARRSRPRPRRRRRCPRRRACAAMAWSPTTWARSHRRRCGSSSASPPPPSSSTISPATSSTSAGDVAHRLGIDPSLQSGGP